MDDSHTPRGLVENLISHSKIDETVCISSSDASKVKRKIHSNNDVGNKKKGKNSDVDSTVMSESTITPRTLIEGLVQGDESVQQSTQRQRIVRRKGLTKNISDKSYTNSPSTSKKVGSLRKKATMKHFLNQSASAGPTPRGMIEGYLMQGAESTPVVGESEKEQMHTTQIDDLLHRRKRVSSLGESYYLPSTAPELSTSNNSGKAITKGRRQKLDPEEFAQRLAEQRKQVTDDTTKNVSVSNEKNISVTTNLVNLDNEETGGLGSYVVGYDKTEELKRKMSSRNISMATPETDITMPSMSDLETPQSNSSRKETQLHQTEGNDRSSPSPPRRRSTRLSSMSSKTPQTDTEGSSVTVSKSGFTTRRSSQSRTEAFTDVTPLDNNSDMTGKENTENRANLQKNDIISDKKEDVDDEDEDDDENDKEVSSSDDENDKEVSESEESDEEREVSESDADVAEDIAADDGNHISTNLNETGADMFAPDGSDIESTVLHDTAVQNSILKGYDTMRTPHLPSRKSTPARSTLKPKQSVPSTSQVTETVPSKDKATKKVSKKKTTASNVPPRLPRALTKSIFTKFAKFKSSKAVIDEVEKIADVYWDNLVEDLTAYAAHAGRITIEQSDIELLMKRQGFITDNQSLHTLIRKHLPMEYRVELIPCAKAGGVVYPKK